MRKAREHEIQIALDIAFQASPDHPYVKDHRQWFRSRPDGTIQYAENPPKKYQDIYPFDFERRIGRPCGVSFERFPVLDRARCRDFPRRQSSHQSISFLGVGDRGSEAAHPQVLFLSEAFTRPKVMYRLGKLGFSQSYTYFPWRHTKEEITDYFTELTQTDVRDFFRGNHWPNTPDILTEFLQTSERPGFMMRFCSHLF